MYQNSINFNTHLWAGCVQSRKSPKCKLLSSPLRWVTSLLFFPIFFLVQCDLLAQSFPLKQGIELQGEDINNGTALDFGPDGRPYVIQENGIIKIYTIQKNGSNYEVTATETLQQVNDIPNHDEDGQPCGTNPSAQIAVKNATLSDSFDTSGSETP